MNSCLSHVADRRGEFSYHHRRVREQDGAEMLGWAPAVVPVAGVCAALGFVMMRRKAF